MTASLGNFQNGAYGSNLDGSVYPQTIFDAKRAPSTGDIYPAGTRWVDNSVNPKIIYETTGAGNWLTGGAPLATTTVPGSVLLTDNSSPIATKAYADSLAIAGAPVASTTVAGIGQLSTDAEAVAGTASTGALALFVTPSNLAAVFAASPAIGGTTPAAASFTTLGATGLASLSGSATITTGATALNLASDASTGAVNIGTGAGARTITIGNVTGATAVAVNTGTGSFTVTSTGTGDIVLNSADTVLIDSAGVLELNSSAGVIGIGNDAVAQAINIGTGAAARTITLGNGTGATSLVLNAGTGAINIGTNAVAHTITIGNQTGATAVVIDSGTGAINIGTAIAKTITIGNVTGASSINLQSGSGNVSVTGGHLAIASVAKTLLVNGGAVTDFIGTGVLTAGTQTIANTNIATGDVIILTRTAVNASTTLGVLTYTIVNATSFTVTSVILGTPGSTQTGDLSSYAYFIVRPT